MDKPGMRARLFAICAIATMTMIGCSGEDGKDGKDGETVITGLLSASSATSLEIDIDDVSVNSAPVVSFSAKDASGVPIAGLTTSHVRFTIATLIAGTNGDPSYWKNYVTSGNGQATYERSGDLEDLGNGKYTYTFDKDITTDPDYSPSRTHRVVMQIDGFPPTNPFFEFRPDGGAVSTRRDIVKTESCNSCHNKLALHGGGRIEIRYCTQCHTPQTIDPDTGNTVDFPVLIHKIHRGEELPSVAYGPDLIDDGGANDDGTGVYQIIGYGGSVHDYSTVVFPQDIRNCTKCHDGSGTAATNPNYTPQGNNWKTRMSMKACGSCHDNIDFSKDGSPAGANNPLGHPGGIVNDNSECITCHAAGRIAGSVEKSHALPVNVAAGKFEFNILEVCGDVVATTDPDCSGSPVTPTVKFSVTDPSNGDAPFDVVNDPQFGSGASLNILTAWDSSDYSNDGGSGSRPARANSFSLNNIKSCVTAGIVCSDNGDGTFTVTLGAMPGGVTGGSGGVAIEGHPLGESVVGSGTFDISVPVRGVTAYFGINGDPMVERRVAVDITAKCDNCHRLLSLHGNNRADNAQLCVMCHNPRNTDVGRRPTDGSGAPAVSPVDGQREQSIDMKVLIHAIHAGQRDDPNTPAVEGHGIREKGIVIYGYGGGANDFSHVRFPGIINDCTTCHNTGTYELDGKWASPLQNGILATTVEAAPNAVDGATLTSGAADQTDDLFTTPTAAVCSACHTSDVDKAHMEYMGGARFAVDQATIAGSFETCSVCHGPGKIADLNVVHDIE